MACLAALAALALALPQGARASGPPAVSPEFYGANMTLLFNWPADRWDAHLRAVAASGTGLVRRDADWWTAEPSAPDPSTGRHVYHWSAFDAYVRAMALRGLRWYPVLGYSTPWAGVLGSDKSAPRRDADYTAYVQAFAARYGRGGAFWSQNPALPQRPVTSFEIWNEQNSPHFWAPQSNAPERYADLYLAARRAIRNVDASARVVVGGLSNVPSFTPDTEFLRRMYRHRPDARGNVDAIGFHPYSGRIEGVYSEIRRMRRALTDLGAGNVPLELTELGWTSTRTPEAERADALARLLSEIPRSDCNISRLIPYSWLTKESNPSDAEDWFGIYNHDATPKPSGAAFSATVRRMTGRGSTPAPRDRVAICGTAPAPSGARPPAKRAGLRLRLRVRGSVRRGLRVKSWCSEPCRVRVALVARRGGRSRRLTIRRLLVPARRQRVRIPGGRRLLRARGRVRLKLTASAPSGRAVVTRRLRRR